MLLNSAVLSVDGMELKRSFPTHCLHCAVVNVSRVYIIDVSRRASSQHKGKLECPVTLVTTQNYIKVSGFYYVLIH